MTCIADSGALYALYDANDAHHKEVVRFFKTERESIIIPAVALTEVDYLLREFLGIDAELDFLKAVSGGLFTVESVNRGDLERCLELIRMYRDLDLGLVDTAVIAIAERLKVKE